MDYSKLKQGTQCIHSEKYELKEYTGVTTPIFTATAYEYINQSKTVYPRYYNTPNLEVTEKKIARLEGGEGAVLFSSGMAATMTALFSLLRQGDHLILQDDLYGGTFDSVNVELKKMGIEISYAKASAVSFEQVIQPNTKVIFLESPSNPILSISPIEEIVSLCKSKGIITLFDNTFASPINQNPLELGIDIVMHSGTKYLGGHSDLCCGVVVSNNGFIKKIRETGVHFGGNMDPQAAFLLERSLKTLDLRVKKQTENAMVVATWLEQHPKVARVFYPGLPTHPRHDIAKKQMKGFGAMLSFEVLVDPDQFVLNLEMIAPVISLGAVESTICSPIQTSHFRMSPAERQAIGIKDNLLRMSVGIEDSQDIINDLEQALISTK